MRLPISRVPQHLPCEPLWCIFAPYLPDHVVGLEHISPTPRRVYERVYEKVYSHIIIFLQTTELPCSSCPSLSGTDSPHRIQSSRHCPTSTSIDPATLSTCGWHDAGHALRTRGKNMCCGSISTMDSKGAPRTIVAAWQPTARRHHFKASSARPHQRDAAFRPEL